MKKNLPERPNVILIMTDDQGYGDVGFHGNTIVKTPRLDLFAEQAVELTNFHTGTTCTPTRAGLMTGRNANRNGAWHTIAGASILNEEEETIAEVFQKNGYRTAMFGKWHLGDSYPYRPHDRGFEETFYHGGGGVQQTPDYWNNDYFDDTYFRNGKPEKTSGYCTDVWFNETISYIKKQKDSPFFIYLATNAAHGPFNVPESYKNQYENAELTERQKRFYGMLTNLDDNFGRLEDYLKSEGLFENTILIYTTDNGTAGGISWDKVKKVGYGFNPLRGTKGSHYDGGHRVPFVVSWPKGNVKGGKKSNELVAHVDMLPTLSNMVGIDLKSNAQLDGTDMTSVFVDQKSSKERMLITDTQRKQWPEKYRNPCVMDGPWRLVNNSELYNTTNDLNQKKDLSNEYPERVIAMRKFYDEWWTSTESDWQHSPQYVGSEEENPVLFTIHDMHPEEKIETPWNQNQVRQGVNFPKGYYEMYIQESGEYSIELFRWSPESGLNISETVPAVEATDFNEGLAAGKKLNAKGAYISFDGKKEVLEISDELPSATFKIELAKGPSKFRAGFINMEGIELSAYFIRFKRL
ncbi:MAG: arylsulfatase [Reichenbachiella sp.]